MSIDAPTSPHVAGILARLRELATADDRAKTIKRIPAEEAIGVRMKFVFDLAKENTPLPLIEVEELLDSTYYEARMVAVSILDFMTRMRSLPDERRRELYELYLRRHDRINTWDLVDRAAPRVVGWYLLDKSRAPLFGLARSANIWERRTAITAAFWIIRAGDLDDPLAIAELLLGDEHLIQTSLGTALREIGKIDGARRDAFISRHSQQITATTRRIALG